MSKAKYKLTFWEKVKITLFCGMAVIVGKLIEDHVQEKNKLKTKLKYFSPELHQGIFTKKIVWKERPTPLTQEQLNQKLT